MPANTLAMMQLLAYVYLQNGQPASARILYAALVLLQPDDATLAHGLALAQLEEGQAPAALATLASIDPPQPLTQLLRARACARLGQDQAAQQAMQAFLTQRITAEAA